jgi:hypothetical protein
VTSTVTPVAGAALGVFVLWSLYIMKNREVLRHFSKKYEHSMHRIMPPLTVGAAVLSLAASVYGLGGAEADAALSPWKLCASIFGIITGFFSLSYGLYCMYVVWRTVRRGRGIGKDSGSSQRLGAIPEYARRWYQERHSSQLSDDPEAEFVTDALIARDYLEHVARESARIDQRRQVANAVELLDVDPDDVTWHEDREFAAGGFSTVWRVTYRGAVVAAKVIARPGAQQSIRKAEAWLHGVKKEAAFLHRLSACENIVNVLGIFEKPDGAVVLMEYASGGTLHDYLHGTSMDDASTAGGDLAAATSGTRSAVDALLPPLKQAEQLSILIDVVRGMLFCYSQEPPVHHRCLASPFLRAGLN